MAATPSSDWLVATQDCYLCHLSSTSRNSSCGSAEYPGEAIPNTLASPRLTQVTGGRDAFSRSPLSYSWPQCWSLQSTRRLPGPAAA
ncbi:pancreatic progenitor cell differentiation and proliferation factor-like [Pteropus medius]|uniref:pancreatic progenitor cell differentiation and proliferation factor-like n=1 Tax=Pteropus vampyrus TaxID=132908 RepID=UPI00196B0DDE|nr:pancreatic progenitor cell differentiation and proliferation factor-like [Pteropus giganteus]